MRQLVRLYKAIKLSSVSLSCLMMALCIVCVTSGCAAPPKTDFRDRMRISQSLFGDVHEFFYIPSQGRLSDHLFVQQGKRHPETPSADAHSLVTRLKTGEDRLLRIAVSGPSSSKTQTILLEACHLLEGNHLPHLTLAFIGDSSYSQAIEQCFSTLDAKYVLYPYPIVDPS